MNSAHLFDYTVKILGDHFATRNTPKAVNGSFYSRSFGEKICSILFKLCQNDKAIYSRAVDDFIAFSADFLKLQAELEGSGHYKLKSFEEVQGYFHKSSNSELAYLNGMLLSQAFWVNHHKIFNFFIENFCKGNMPLGSVIEVPVGTGIFISEFMNYNPKWHGSGFDISKESADFAKRVVKINSPVDVQIEKKNIFDIAGSNEFGKVICGELLEHVENPAKLLAKLDSLVSENGKIFLTTAVWAASIDHICLFESAEQVRKMVNSCFDIEKELVLNILPGKKPEDEKTPINYACILSKKKFV